MKNLINLLLDKLWPWRVIRHQARLLEEARDVCTSQSEEIHFLTQERDTARKQFAETRAQNHLNAQVENLTRMQLHQLNVALNDAGLSHLFPIREDQLAFHGKDPKRINASP